MRVKIFLLCLMMFAFSMPAKAADHLYIPMLGDVDWDNNSFTVLGISYDYEDRAELAKGFKFLRRHDNGYAYGGG